MTTMMRPEIATTPVAIVGAGPYGLSIAVHLRARGIGFRIFGVPMETWRTQMPRGMFLKSEGFASNLSDPDGNFSLARFCQERRIPYADVGTPVASSTFSAYGMAFADAYASDLDQRKVASLVRAAAGFTLTLEDGTPVHAERVVVAVGISHYRWLPELLRDAPASLVTHASQHHALDAFAGKRVTVVGAGASAVDLAGLLHEAGARTTLVARTERLVFHDPPQLKRSLYARLRAPRSGLGPSLKSSFYSSCPDVFSLLPARARASIVREAIGPSACWFTRTQIEGKVRTRLGSTLASLDTSDGFVRLGVRDASGTAEIITSDHLIAGTGYRVDLARLAFVPENLRAQIRVFAGAPELSHGFESSVPGLYFAGLAAATTFGPLLRFAFGARFAARRIADALERQSSAKDMRTSVPRSISTQRS